MSHTFVPATAAPVGHWRARLELEFDRVGERTRLLRRRHEGPLCIQRVFHPHDDASCHAYVLHPPGGVVGGDELAIDIALHAGAHALITTPAAAKFYRSAGLRAQQSQRLRVAAGACAEWLPQESIMFNGARLRTHTLVELAPQARFTGWEIVCLGRPAANDTFATGDLQQRFEVWRDQRPLFIERSRFAGGAEALCAAWGLAGASVSGTLVSTDHDAALVADIRALAPATGTATLLAHTLVCRYLGDDALAARTYFAQALALIRAARGHSFSAPRIWAN